MKRIAILITTILTCFGAAAQDNWIKHLYWNDYIGYSVPLSDMLQNGISVDMTLEYRLDMDHPISGWTLGLRMNERTYDYKNQTIEGSNLVSAEIYMTDFLGFVTYRIQPLENWCIAIGTGAGMSMYKHPTVNMANEQVFLNEWIPMARVECALEWYFDDAFGISLSASYLQNFHKSPFSPDLLHDASFCINAGLIFGLF